MISAALTTEWAALVQTIPDDLDASAKEQGALRRRRGVQSAADLLQLILIYATVLSLRTTAVYGVGLQLCDITRQALDKRILHSGPWLRHLLAVLLTTLAPVPPVAAGLIHRVILRDASVIARPGSPGTEWRLHCAWLRTLPADQTTAEITVCAVADPQRRPLRLVVGRLPPDQAMAARDKVTHQAHQDHRTVHPNTLLVAGFCILLTNLPAASWTVALVLAFYRVRWQVELIFKLWRSYGRLARVAGLRRERVLCELYAKMIGLVLTQFLIAPQRLTTLGELSPVKALRVCQRQALAWARSLVDQAQLAHTRGRRDQNAPLWAEKETPETHHHLAATTRHAQYGLA